MGRWRPQRWRLDGRRSERRWRWRGRPGWRQCGRCRRASKAQIWLHHGKAGSELHPHAYRRSTTEKHLERRRTHHFKRCYPRQRRCIRQRRGAAKVVLDVAGCRRHHVRRPRRKENAGLERRRRRQHTPARPQHGVQLEHAVSIVQPTVNVIERDEEPLKRWHLVGRATINQLHLEFCRTHRRGRAVRAAGGYSTESRPRLAR